MSNNLTIDISDLQELSIEVFGNTYILNPRTQKLMEEIKGTVEKYSVENADEFDFYVEALERLLGETSKDDIISKSEGRLDVLYAIFQGALTQFNKGKVKLDLSMNKIKNKEIYSELEQMKETMAEIKPTLDTAREVMKLSEETKVANGGKTFKPNS